MTVSGPQIFGCPCRVQRLEYLVGYGYYMVDIDLGEMFLNFPLPSVLQKFSGIDVS
jgi:hypothetical protein